MNDDFSATCSLRKKEEEDCCCCRKAVISFLKSDGRMAPDRKSYVEFYGSVGTEAGFGAAQQRQRHKS